MRINNHSKYFFFFCLIITLTFHFCDLKAQNKIINGPLGSGQFGKSITILPNGNYIVTDPYFDNASIDVGAVYLFNGKTHAIISTLTGSTANDQIGSEGIIVLKNGNFVIRSTRWNNGSITNAGAATWCNSTTGLNGTVSDSNSLVGDSKDDQIGSSGIIALNNGNYVVSSPRWRISIGAVTWCDGSIGRIGIVNAGNSLVGFSTNDLIGSQVTTLTNGNYVVSSTHWKNSINVSVGAATWCDGTIGRIGYVNSTNSLVGSAYGDLVGAYVLPLTNGNYVVQNPLWDNGALINAGAVTWGNGTSGVMGAVSASNSIVGTNAEDQIGNQIIALTNGNYVIGSPYWDHGSIVNAGAATWCNGSIGTSGSISSSNSLVGTNPNDAISVQALIALPNGNYIVRSSNAKINAVINAGAVTWCDGSSGRIGTIDSTNSLVGSTANDYVGLNGVTILTNGNYIVKNNTWDNGAIVDAGAVTWGNGAAGCFGSINASNSLIGSATNDQVGNGGVIALTNGNYVVNSTNWDNGAITNAGAVTWGNGSTGSVGTLDITNSLVGTASLNPIGNGGTTALTNGNYVVRSATIRIAGINAAGAATWCDGASGRVGTINSSNSLVGSTFNDQIGNAGISPLANGNYVVRSSNWDNGAIGDAGAVTWCDGTKGRSGNISSLNSLIGFTPSDQIGGGFVSFNNGYYIISSSLFDNGAIANGGAYTIAPDNTPIIGEINNCNSVLGDYSNPNPSSFSRHNSLFNYLMISKPAENKIVIREYSLNSSFNQTICANKPFLWNGISQNTSGIYKDTFPSFNGCDSVVTLNLSVYPQLNKSTTLSGNTIHSLQDSATYQWINCTTNIPIDGATNQTYIATFNGSFKAVITKSNCSDTSNCITINNIGLGITTIESNSPESNGIAISPNPASVELNISIDDKSTNVSSFEIINIDGQLVSNKKLNADNKDFKLNISEYINGNYIIHFRDEERNVLKSYKFIKE